jgi:hypothetical protein
VKELHVTSRAAVGAVTFLVAAALASGCSEAEPDPTDSPATGSEAGPSGEDTPTRQAEPSNPELPAAMPATPPYAAPGTPSLIRAHDGSTLAVYEPAWPRERTTYRIYDRRWHPLTPLLMVNVSLEVSRSVPAGFIARASLSRRDGSTALREWVTIDRDGNIRTVTQQPDRRAEAQPLRRGDLFLESSGRALLAYRPSQDAVVKARNPSWNGVGYSWYLDPEEGHVCALLSGPLAEGVMHVSVDEARTFTDVTAADVLPATSGPRLQACWATRDRVLVETGGENPRWLHTLDQDDQTILSSLRVGDRLNPYMFDMLPDGRLVAGTNRPGLMVATDSTNQLMGYRPGPVPPSATFQTVDQEVISIAGRWAHVSADAGLTWRELDLGLP